MSRQTNPTITCDYCGKQVTVNSGTDLPRGWIENSSGEKLDLYEVSIQLTRGRDYCSEECLVNWIFERITKKEVALKVSKMVAERKMRGRPIYAIPSAINKGTVVETD